MDRWLMMRSRKRQGATEQRAGSPAWMMTYGDMVTLVLCFFVLLYSMSSVDVRKFEQAAVSLQGTFGIMKGGRPESVDEPVIPVDVPEPDDTEPEWEQLDEVWERLERAIGDNAMVTLVSVQLEQRGLIVRFAEGVLFDVGKADLRPEAIPILTAISEILAELPNALRVEGHTDNSPINTERFPSNWELSAIRATTVIRFLLTEFGFEPARLAAAGYGEYWPIADNETVDGRQKNRRVDIVILPVQDVHTAEEREGS